MRGPENVLLQDFLIVLGGRNLIEKHPILEDLEDGRKNSSSDQILNRADGELDLHEAVLLDDGIDQLRLIDPPKRLPIKAKGDGIKKRRLP